MAPPIGNVGESECANGSTNINCNDIGIPQHEAAPPMRPLPPSPMYGRGHRVLFAQTNSAPLQRDLSTADPLAVRSLWATVGGEGSLGHMWRWAYRRSADERGQGIRAANDLAAAPLSRENRETLSCPVKAQPAFAGPRLTTTSHDGHHRSTVAAASGSRHASWAVESPEPPLERFRKSRWFHRIDRWSSFRGNS